jgi:hypothetical protein
VKVRKSLRLTGIPSFQKHSVRLTCPSSSIIVKLQLFPLFENLGLMKP